MKLLQKNIFHTIAKVLSKSKLLLLLFIFFFISCKSQELKYEDLKALNSTHIIKNDIVFELLAKLQLHEKLFSNKSDCIYLDFKKNKENDYTVSATHLTYLDSKILKHDSNKKLKGYINYSDKVIFLFGDIDEFLFMRNNIKIENVLKTSYKVDKNHPPVALHINFITYHIFNNKLTELNNQ
ncbi:hypothetical protein [Flavobacterium ajazii]|uniref:hypothetical protein n=1 Tax=Flavobacterium ajazii TaxID=2692318 RepID=UPI0013D822C5|nr:hypothetical protein [Flavobacterium ajazii]